MRHLSTASIIGFAIILSLAVQNVRSADWKPEWTGPHPGWLTYKTNRLEIYYAPDSVLAKDGAIRKFAGQRVPGNRLMTSNSAASTESRSRRWTPNGGHS